jgi:hypothetical protein
VSPPKNFKAHTMYLHTFNPSKQTTEFEFYILCKGNNSGRPMVSPLPNCFVCVCQSLEERDFFFWLCYGLFSGKAFETSLKGSVVPFVRICDVLQILTKHAAHINAIKWAATIQQLKHIEALEANLCKQIKLLQSLKVALVREQIKR